MVYLKLVIKMARYHSDINIDIKIQPILSNQSIE
jgi:hypothetical protein